MQRLHKETYQIFVCTFCGLHKSFGPIYKNAQLAVDLGEEKGENSKRCRKTRKKIQRTILPGLPKLKN